MNEFEIGGVSEGIFEEFELFNCSASNSTCKIFYISELMLNKLYFS